MDSKYLRNRKLWELGEVRPRLSGQAVVGLTLATMLLVAATVLFWGEITTGHTRPIAAQETEASPWAVLAERDQYEIRADGASFYCRDFEPSYGRILLFRNAGEMLVLEGSIIEVAPIKK